MQRGFNGDRNQTSSECRLLVGHEPNPAAIVEHCFVFPVRRRDYRWNESWSEADFAESPPTDQTRSADADHIERTVFHMTFTRFDRLVGPTGEPCPIGPVTVHGTGYRTRVDRRSRHITSRASRGLCTRLR